MTRPPKATERPVVENSEYIQFLRRIARAASKRAGADIDMLPELRAIADLVDELMRDSVTACNDEGYSWTEIGERLGITKQSAYERYGPPSVARRTAVRDTLTKRAG